MPAFLPDTATVRADHAHYYDLMHTMDGYVGRVAKLEADGVLDDTIIFFFGDNGGAVHGASGSRASAGFGSHHLVRPQLPPPHPQAGPDAPVAGVDPHRAT